MLRLIRSAVVMGSCAILGCASNADSSKMTADAPTNTELAAYAARTPYPQGDATDDHRVAALINHDRSTLRLYNFSSDPLPDVDVWVNSAWLQHVRGIPANGSVSVKTGDLYNAFGKSFSSQAEPVTKVQLGIGGKLHNAMGPITE